ncbi:MAG: UDP-3-O-(3-hydroxymyristoyl)glucosamine N-acyltransferase [Planctomyces sp.]|nr:UDP-3-O-(3-hydroxymyristoyl)glucosamine N-acyltransferase [Planctomyces sp.]
MEIRVEDLAARIGCDVQGDGAQRVSDVRPLDEAGPEHLSFAAGTRPMKRIAASAAGAVIVPRKAAAGLDAARTWLLSDDAQAAFIAAMLLFRPATSRGVSGISSGAYVSPSARIGRETNVFPGAYVGEGAIIGDHCDIGPGAVVGAGCRLGAFVTLHPNAVLYAGVQTGDRVIVHANAVIGADGFGYRFVDGRYEKIPHTGTVVLEDDVEIGACTTVDRGMVGATRIGAGTKLDNLVMIGHNCRLGRHNAFASQVGLAGSVTTGDYVRCAGQVGIADHLHMGRGSTLGAKAGVMDDIPEGGHYIGLPAVPEKDAFRQLVTVAKLPDLIQQVKSLTKQVAELEAALECAARTKAA